MGPHFKYIDKSSHCKVRCLKEATGYKNTAPKYMSMMYMICWEQYIDADIRCHIYIYIYVTKKEAEETCIYMYIYICIHVYHIYVYIRL